MVLVICSSCEEHILILCIRMKLLLYFILLKTLSVRCCLAPCTQSTSIRSLLPRWLWAAWAHVDVWEGAHQQCANNKLLDVSERVSTHQLPLRPESTTGWLIAHSECIRWDLSMVFRFRTVPVFLTDMARLPETHPSDPPISPGGVYGREVRRATWR